MKSSVPVPLNKKLILHFDIQNVIRLPTNIDKQYFVYDLCSNWVWGKLEYNSKEDPDKVTGWKLSQNTLAAQKPDPQLISYRQYLDQHLKPSAQERQKLIVNLSKGAAAKAKNQIEKNIKNTTVPKTLLQPLKESGEGGNIGKRYFETGKYELLPVFYKLLLSLKKAKRQFAVIIRNSNLQDNHQFIIEQLNMFFNGAHPLYNGKNGTPLVKMDGSKGTKNFVIAETNKSVFYYFGETQLFSTFGTTTVSPLQKDVELFKQKFKSRKNIKFCQGFDEIYSYSHSILSQSACIYQVNNRNFIVYDPVDYLTQQIYFTNVADLSQISSYNVLGEKLQSQSNLSFIKVEVFELLKDVDYFIKKLQKAENDRAAQIQKRQKGEQAEEEAIGEESHQQKEVSKQTNSQYLRKNLIPVLDGALRQVDLLRPEDPISFIALYCLKYKDRLQN